MVMPLRPGQKVRAQAAAHGYTCLEEISRGAFAIAYRAEDHQGRAVFLKQYKTPSPLMSWYRPFLQHQNELKRRIEADAALRERACRPIQFFEADRHLGFFQCFEFIEGGMNLQDCLDRREEFTWEQLKIFAKVLMFAVKSLHHAGIVHTDLKPENVILIPNPAISFGYNLKLIDMDWSVLTQENPPWHGHREYVGTPYYLSPEHLRGQKPDPSSDIFTCGIMLAELLGNGHPFSEGEEDFPYDARALAGTFQDIQLEADFEDQGQANGLKDTIVRSLCPDPSKRPTAPEIIEALSGRSRRPENIAVAQPAGTRKTCLTIFFGDRKITEVNVATRMGKAHFRSLDDDAQFLSEPQFHIYPTEDGWAIAHEQSATNETLVDGNKLHDRVYVRDGMRIGVGNSKKGIEKFPLTLRLH